MSEKLTAREVADELGYHINHVYRLLKNGKMRGEQFNRVWMIDRAELDRWLEARKSRGADRQ